MLAGMNRRVGVAPGTITLLNTGFGRAWMDPGGPIPASPPEPQVQFLTSPFTPPATTTPRIYLGAGPPPFGPCSGLRMRPVGPQVIPDLGLGAVEAAPKRFSVGLKLLVIGLGVAAAGTGLYLGLRS